jgi:hypothetical protein
MPVPLIHCRNTVTGAEAEIPETALGYMSDWVRLDEGEPSGPGESAASTESSDTPSTPGERDAAAQPPAHPTGKSKAAATAKTTDERK